MQYSDLHQHLEKCLQNLILGIEQGHTVAGVTLQTVTTSDLAKFVGLGVEGDATLLRLLGYTADDAELLSPRTGQGGKPPDTPRYLLRHKQQAVTVLELKPPHKSLDVTEWVEELSSYCQKIEAPFGLLFNGTSLRVVMNTCSEPLAKYQPQCSGRPVASADHIDLSPFAELLSRFAVSSLQDPMVLAHQLAQEAQESATADEETRQEKIGSVLMTFLTSSPTTNTEALLLILVSADFVWQEFSPKPTLDELRAAWNAVVCPVPSEIPSALPSEASLQTAHNLPSHKKLGVNPALRAKVVQICAQKGWEAIEEKQISGMNYRLDGGTDKGYRPVPPGPNVPPGLCIQGLSSPAAKRVMQELDRLLDV